MCFHAHPILAQSVIPVPLKMEKGTGSFLLSEKTRLYTNLQGGEAKLWEKYLKALPVQLKEARKKDRKQMLPDHCRKEENIKIILNLITAGKIITIVQPGCLF